MTLKNTILKYFPNLTNKDVKIAKGELHLSPAARKILPISIECKNVEKLNVWQSWAQATANAKDWNPVLIFKRNRSKPLVVCELDYFLSLHSDCNRLAELVTGVK